MLAFPYGIGVNPKDGSIWYAKLYANKIGRVDPMSMEVRESDTPLSGPRRPRFDKDGILWIPAFDDGALMRFDPATAKFEWRVTGVAPGEYETPYALNVWRPTGEVWMAANNSDRVLRFSPATKTFQSYPAPRGSRSCAISRSRKRGACAHRSRTSRPTPSRTSVRRTCASTPSAASGTGRRSPAGDR